MGALCLHCHTRAVLASTVCLSRLSCSASPACHFRLVGRRPVLNSGVLGNTQPFYTYFHVSCCPLPPSLPPSPIYPSTLHHLPCLHHPPLNTFKAPSPFSTCDWTRPITIPPPPPPSPSPPLPIVSAVRVVAGVFGVSPAVSRSQQSSADYRSSLLLLPLCAGRPNIVLAALLICRIYEAKDLRNALRSMLCLAFKKNSK